VHFGAPDVVLHLAGIYGLSHAEAYQWLADFHARAEARALLCDAIERQTDPTELALIADYLSCRIDALTTAP
jgi:hypothetical protein